MAALDQDQLVYIRRQVGSKPTDADLQTIYDRSGDVDGLILEVLETRYAELIRVPAQFAVSGEYSQATEANIKALKAQIQAWRSYMVSIGKEVGPDPFMSTVVFTDTTPPSWR